MRAPAVPGSGASGVTRSCLLAFGAVWLTWSTTAALATPDSMDRQVKTVGTVAEKTDFGFRNGSVVAAPIPFSNPTIGSGLVLGLGYLFNLDPGSKPSVIGVAGLASDNDSRAYGVSVNLYFDNNRWLLESLFAQADIRYDLFTSLTRIPVRQDGLIGRISLSYGVTPELSFGGSLRYLKTNVNLDVPGLPPLPPPNENLLSTELLNIGFVSEWDTRDDTLYPTRGQHLEFEASRGTALDNSIDDYDKGYINYTHYLPIGGGGVAVGRASLCAASSTAPFFDQCSLGGTDSFRGFSLTQFLDLRSASVQGEYRHTLTNRFRGVLFAGVGQVGPNLKQLDNGGSHSAAGAGIRYRVSQKFSVDLALDWTRNNLSESLVYVYVGQRF